MVPSPEDDGRFLRLAMEAARRARERGNHPFGAVLVDSASRILLEAENSVLTDRDPTAHAELSLIRTAGARCLLRPFVVSAPVQCCPRFGRGSEGIGQLAL